MGDRTVRLWSTELKSNLLIYKGSRDSKARLWVTDRREPLRTFSGHKSDVDCVAWHPDCHHIFTASDDYSIRMWHVLTGQCIRIFSGLQSSATSLSVSPDGKFVVAGTYSGEIISWDIGKAKIKGELNGHLAPIWSLSFADSSPNFLASGGEDGTVKIWDCSLACTSVQNQILSPKNGLLANWTTEKTSVYSLKFTTRNLLMGAGVSLIKHQVFE